MKFMITCSVRTVMHCKCLLQKSLPLLRQSLVAKELVIEGIRPPPHHTVVFSLPNSATVVPQLQVSWCYMFSEYIFQRWNQAWHWQEEFLMIYGRSACHNKAVSWWLISITGVSNTCHNTSFITPLYYVTYCNWLAVYSIYIV